jgi:hypothetical protein
MITPERPRHNGAPARRAGALVGLLLLAALPLATGCSDQQDSRDGEAPAENAAATDCRISTDTSGWTAFTDLADRVAAGDNPSKAEFDAYGDLPAVTLWRNSLTPNTPRASRVGNWLEAAFWEQLEREGMQKTSAERANFSRRYTYCLSRREVIEEKLAALTGPRTCDLEELATYWIDPANLPETLTVFYLPGKPEIRISGDNLLVDTGVVAAGNTDQVIRQMVSLLYRNFQFVTGANPLDLEGEQAVVQAFRVLVNEGMTGWVEKAVDMEFDSRHPELYKVKIIPEEFFLKAQAAVGMMNRQLGDILADEETLAEKGNPFARHLAGMNAFSQTGYAMAAVISGHFGDERLKEVRDSVPAFVAAYQEAALLNPDPAPTPGDVGVVLYRTVPPLKPEVFSALMAILEKNFPE